MQNKSKGTILTLIGVSILTIIGIILYYVNRTVLWVSETLGATPEAGIGIQIVVVIIAVLMLLSIIIAGIICVGLGVLYLRDITPSDVLDKIHGRFTKNFFGDDDFFKRF